MPYNLVVRRLAALDIIEAYDYYEQRREGLGQGFLDELESFNNSLLKNPFIHSYYEEPIRQGNLDRFPDVVVYEIIDDTIVIYSVFMTNKEPSKKRTK